MSVLTIAVCHCVDRSTNNTVAVFVGCPISQMFRLGLVFLFTYRVLPKDWDRQMLDVKSICRLQAFPSKAAFYHLFLVFVYQIHLKLESSNSSDTISFLQQQKGIREHTIAVCRGRAMLLHGKKGSST